MRKILHWLAALAVASAVLTLSSVEAAHAAGDQATFGVQTADGKKPDLRPNFSYSATPGATIPDHIAVLNYSAAPLTLKIYAADAFNTSSGGFDLLTADKKSRDVGAWATLGQPAVTVPSRGTVIVPFKVAIPLNATPGDHAGGIVAVLTTQAKDAKGNIINVDQRVGLRIYLRISGPLQPGLEITGMAGHYEGTWNPFGRGKATIRYTVRNTGNVRLAGRQAVRLGNIFGTSLRGSGFESLPELLPGNEYSVIVPIDEVLPAFRSTVSVTLDPVPVAGDKDPKAKPVTVRAVFWTVPWTLVVILAVIIAATAPLYLGSLVRLVLRRRPPGKPGHPTRRRIPVKSAALLLAILALVTMVPATRAAAAAGTLYVDPFDGHDTSRNNVVTSGPCPSTAPNLIARLRGPGFPKDGQIVQANTPVDHYQKTSSGGLIIPLLDTFQAFAAQQSPPAKLSGTYTITVSCIKPLAQWQSLGDFTGTIKFTSPTAYSFQGKRPSIAPTPSASAPAVDEGATVPDPGQSTVVTDLAGRGSTTDEGGLVAAIAIFAVVAAVIGGLILLNRRRSVGEPS
jgi:Bacterial protein of unknown function (DUF916)